MTERVLVSAPAKARPFLKWAGGKSQLIEQITAYLPPALKRGKTTRYVEPFVGSGALFFHVAQKYQVQEFFLFDVNEELVLAYNTIKKSAAQLIDCLCHLQEEYQSSSRAEREEMFYRVRDSFNKKRQEINFGQFDDSWSERTAQLIFLNRTCFNGLFRVNARGEFNVPFGGYTNPRICNSENLVAVSQLLQKAIIERGDFTNCEPVVNSSTFVYFDPPYRPISATSSFTSYSRHDFGEHEQRRLADFYRELDKRDAKLMLSNSDPKNENQHDNFFEELYQGFNIKRVQASRMINSDATKRGKISELLVMNYKSSFWRNGNE
jgi:DNA adenine methylase